MASTFQPFDLDTEVSPEDQERAAANRERTFIRMVQHAFAGSPLTADELADWHRELLDGLSFVPDPCYLGGYRGSAHPWLRDYNVRVRAHLAVSAHQVPEELERFFRLLDFQFSRIAEAAHPERPLARGDILKVVSLAAWAHGEWVRVHPFANANGRTARLLANWVLARFRLPPVVRVRPRPGSSYARAATASMKGQHNLTARWILRLLDAASTPGKE